MTTKKKSQPADIIAGRAKSRGLSMNGLCRKTGIPTGTMSDHMKDPGTFRFWQLISISKAVDGFSVPELEALGIKIRSESEV